MLVLLCRYGRKALQEMYQVFLRRRTPNSLATPAWMADALADVAPEDLEKTRAQLFEVIQPKRKGTRPSSTFSNLER